MTPETRYVNCLVVAAAIVFMSSLIALPITGLAIVLTEMWR